MYLLRLLVLFIITVPYVTHAQELNQRKKYQVSAVGFWNVENLYDTLDDRRKNDDDFTPSGTNAWNSARYWLKIEHLSDVISQMAIEATPDGLALIGLCEVENKTVLNDLVKSDKLKKRYYQVVLIEGPDARGVDPALIYNPRYFALKKAVTYRVKLYPDSGHKTRDVLVVGGLFLDEPVTILVNHWPSRRGGERQSRANRIAAAKVVKHITDSVNKTGDKVKVLIMGDFNDDPVSESVKRYIGTYSNPKEVHDSLFFNPMEKLYRQGSGTLAWQDNWNLFDQVLLHPRWLYGDYHSWQYYDARVFNPPFLKNDFGRFKGYPFRTFSGANYTAGYSDHFPVYVILAKEKTK